MTDVLKLWFVSAEETDLFVRAYSKEDAAWRWRRYYAEWDLPSRVTITEVPSVDGPAGAINWTDLIPVGKI